MRQQLSTAFTGFTELAALSVVISVCVLFKWSFAEADALQLDWLLAPTSKIVSFFSGLSFSGMGSEGYLSYATGVFIIPACSGLNFFIILTATGSCLCVCSGGSFRYRLLLCSVMPVIAFPLAICVNAQRILLAMYLHQLDSGLLPVSPEQLHRMEGVMVYYVYLCLFVMLLSRLLPTAKSTQRRCFMLLAGANGWTKPLIPLGCYLLFTLGIPLANGALRKIPQYFMQHSATVLLISGTLTLLFYAFARKDRSRSKK